MGGLVRYHHPPPLMWHVPPSLDHGQAGTAEWDRCLLNFLNAPLVTATTSPCYFLVANSLFTFSSISTSTEAGDAFPSRTC